MTWGDFVMADVVAQDVRAISINKIPMINRRSKISDVETFNTFKQSVHDPFLNDIANEIQLKKSPLQYQQLSNALI